MENSNENSTLSTLWIITSILIFFVSLFYLLYNFIANRAQRTITKAVAWLTILFLELDSGLLLYDRVLNPLKSGPRWPKQDEIIIVLCIMYVVWCIVACWESYKARSMDLDDAIVDD